MRVARPRRGFRSDAAEAGQTKRSLVFNDFLQELGFMQIFDYDNILLLPRKCRVESRSECDTSVTLGGRTFRLPVVPANMKTVVDESICLWLAQNGYFYVMHRFDLGLICMAIIALLIARRVIPFFAMRGVQGLTLPMQTRSGHVQLTFGVLAIILGIFNLSALMGVALAVVGLISLVQVITWKPDAVKHKPILWILYVGYTFLGLGLILAALHVAGLSTSLFGRSAVHVHVIAMGGFSVLIIGMVTRTALGHLGRPLVTTRSMRIAYALVLIAFAFRVAALWPVPASVHFLHLAAAAWIVAFGLYLWDFVPMLIRPRPDQTAPKPATQMKVAPAATKAQ